MNIKLWLYFRSLKAEVFASFTLHLHSLDIAKCTFRPTLWFWSLKSSINMVLSTFNASTVENLRNKPLLNEFECHYIGFCLEGSENHQLSSVRLILTKTPPVLSLAPATQFFLNDFRSSNRQLAWYRAPSFCTVSCLRRGEHKTPSTRARLWSDRGRPGARISQTAFLYIFLRFFLTASSVLQPEIIVLSFNADPLAVLV